MKNSIPNNFFDFVGHGLTKPLNLSNKKKYEQSPFLNNEVLTIYPYVDENGGWVFDEPKLGLVKEGLVLGIDIMIDHITWYRGIENAEDGFKCVFSSKPLPNSDVLDLVGPAELDADPMDVGNIYALRGTELQGWLCPALYYFFSEAPEHIYIVVQPLKKT